MQDDANQNDILDSIFNGNSEYIIKCNEQHTKFYIKHLGCRESIKLFNAYENAKQRYIKEGLMSKDEQLEFIFNKGWWSQEKENEIKYIVNSIERFEQTKKKLIYQSDKKRISEQIRDLKIKLLILQKEKSDFLSSTADDIAGHDAAIFFIENFIFVDEYFKKNIVVDDNDDQCFNNLIKLYYKYFDDYSSDKIKRAALSLEFQNILYISDGSCIDVFGMPAIKLTKNQADLLMWGGYFQKLIKNSQKEIPNEMYNDPNKFIEWYESVNKIELNKKNTNKKTKGKSKYGSESKFLFGERDEIKQIGGKISGDIVLKEAEKAGSLGLYDLMEK